MLITRYVMHRACATFCDFSPLLLLLSVANYRFLIPILKCSNTLINTGVWSLIELASLYTVPLSAVNGLSRLTTTSNGQTRPIRKFSNWPITVESNRIITVESNQIVTADSNSNRISKLRRSLPLILLGAPVTDLFVKCHLKLHIDITLHYICKEWWDF